MRGNNFVIKCPLLVAVIFQNIGISTTRSIQCWRRKNSLSQKNCKYHTMVFFKSSLETLIPLPNNKKFNAPAQPHKLSIGWCPWRHSPSLELACLSFLHYRIPRLCQVTKSKWKTSQVIGTAFVFFSLLTVTQWAASPPLSHILQNCSDFWPGFPTPYTTLLHMTATSCLSYTFYTLTFL